MFSNFVLLLDPNYYSLQNIALAMIVGILWYSLLFVWIFYLYKVHCINYAYLWKITSTAALLQILAGTAYWYFPYNPDSLSYFYNYYHLYSGFGYSTTFCLFLIKHLRALFLGDSIFAAFLFSSGFGLIGTVYYFLTFKLIAEKQGYSFADFKHLRYLIFPMMLIFFWPSKFYFSSGIAKDSLCFWSMSLFFYYSTVFYYQKRYHALWLAILCAAFMGFIRPYLFIILVGALILGYLPASKMSTLKKTFYLIIFIALFCAALYAIQNLTLLNISFSGIIDFAYQTQVIQTQGTAIPLLATSSQEVLWFLPYTMIANAFLPLFFPVNNAMGILASFENIVLLGLVWYWLKHRKQVLKADRGLCGFFNWFFFFGILYLGMFNTNLGLAMRQKLMFLPIFIVSIGVVYLAKNRKNI